MGSVFLTRSRGNRPLALKVIRSEHAQDDSFRDRFAREVEAASRVAGYHLLPVLDYDLQGPRPWMATEFKPGLSLQDLLVQHGPLPTGTALQLAGCAALALEAVHAAGFVHRDVKPSNLLVTENGPWVIDFGIARAAASTRLTVTGGLIGTPQFMSPEHASGLELTAASDVFALALVTAVRQPAATLTAMPQASPWRLSSRRPRAGHRAWTGIQGPYGASSGQHSPQHPRTVLPPKSSPGSAVGKAAGPFATWPAGCRTR
jgi:serine/threonine protein kinase